MKTSKTFEHSILQLLFYRKPGTTVCPSELLPPKQKKDKKMMDLVREAARALVKKNKIEILQKGKVVTDSNIVGPIRLRLKEEELVYLSRTFDYSLDYKKLDLRKNSELYKVGVKEQGVLLVEPYKSELVPLWRFKTPTIAEKSASAIYQKFLEYKKQEDFPGMDMSRKFLQMGFTRSRRYANHAGGKKYSGAVPLSRKGMSGSHGRELLPFNNDPEKAASAEIFSTYLQKVEEDSEYLFLKIGWKSLFG
jgi:hypothetical protein